MLASVATTLDNEKTNQIQNILHKQRVSYCFNSNPSYEERCHLLSKLETELRKYKEELAEALNQDFSCRSFDETMLAEIMVTIESIKYHKKNLKTWMKPSKRRVSALFAPASNQVVYQPKGVVGIIAPWNYPLQLSLVPLVTALSAGNRAVIKLSEYTPTTNIVLEKMLAEAYDEDVVAVVTGGPEIGELFSKQKWDHLIFTGSTEIGKHVMQAASKNLVPVTLELGGKSPCIVTNKADIESAAAAIVFGKVTNAGQTCIAPDYLLCPRELEQSLIQAITNKYKEYYPDIKANNDHTAIINKRQFDRLKGYLSDAAEKGAAIIELNNAEENFEETRKIPLTLVRNTTDQMTLMQNEIFGPLLPILTYDSLVEATNYINSRPRPLALYLFSHSAREQQMIIDSTHAGGIGINECLLHAAQDDLPFGGIGDSGLGHYHAKEGFLSLSHAKSIHKKGKFYTGKYIHAPYGRLAHKIIYKYLIN